MVASVRSQATRTSTLARTTACTSWPPRLAGRRVGRVRADLSSGGETGSCRLPKCARVPWAWPPSAPRGRGAASGTQSRGTFKAFDVISADGRCAEQKRFRLTSERRVALMQGPSPTLSPTLPRGAAPEIRFGERERRALATSRPEHLHATPKSAPECCCIRRRAPSGMAVRGSIGKSLRGPFGMTC